MSTIIFNIVVIMAIIFVGGYITFILVSLLFPGKKEDGEEDSKDYDTDIKLLEARQKDLYNRLLALGECKEELKEEVLEDAEEENKEEVVAEEEIKEEEVPAPVQEVEEAEEEEGDKFVQGTAEEEPQRKKMPSRRRSFGLKLASSTETTKRYFSEITNRLRLYGLTARIGKSKVMFRSNKEVYAKMIFKGKRIILCLPLNPKSDKFDPEVYKQLDLSEKKGFEELAFGLKLTNKKVVDQAFELIDEVAKKFDLVENPKFKEIDYVEKYPDIYSDFEKKGYGYLLKTEVSKEEAQAYDDAFAEKILLEQKVEGPAPKRLVRAEITLQEFNNRYTDTSVPVDLDRLKTSDLVQKNSNYLIVKASARIDKPFVVYAHEFEADAVKMICMAGGKAVKLVYSEE